MTTINQLIRNPRKRKKKKKIIQSILGGSPQRRGKCQAQFTRKPKKPNSANRALLKATLTNGKEVTVHVPGEGHNLQQFSSILVRGGRAKDMPGVKLRVVRGWGDDEEGVSGRKQSRSKYGAKKK